jgi:hypothetical protein
VNAELHQLRERCDAFDALADAPGTPDGWLSYRAMALRDQLHESARQDPALPSSLERVCTALIVQKALGVVRSHYEVNFEALAEGYVVPEGVEDEVAWSAWTRSPPTPPGHLPKPSRSSSSRTLLMPPLLLHEDSRALGLFLLMYQYAGRAALVNKQIIFAKNICQCEVKSFVYYAFLCFSFFLSRF